MLVWFCIRAKLRAHTLRHPCLACPSRCTEPLYPHDHCKRTIIHRSHQPFSKPHYPSKIAITLASLVKGEVLSPEKNSGDYRRDCHTTIPLAFRRASVCVCLYGFASALSHLAFRRVSVCVCLVGFASLQSPWAHTLRHPCLACPSRCT